MAIISKMSGRSDTTRQEQGTIADYLDSNASTFSMLPLAPPRARLPCAIAVHIDCLVAAGHAKVQHDFITKIATQPGRPYGRPGRVSGGDRKGLSDARSTFPDRGRFGVSLNMPPTRRSSARNGDGESRRPPAMRSSPSRFSTCSLRTDLWSTAIATIAVAVAPRRRVPAALGFAAGLPSLWPLPFLPPCSCRPAAACASHRCWQRWRAARRSRRLAAGRRHQAPGVDLRSERGRKRTVAPSDGDRPEHDADRSGAWRIGSTSGPISILLLPSAGRHRSG